MKIFGDRQAWWSPTFLSIFQKKENEVKQVRILPHASRNVVEGIYTVIPSAGGRHVQTNCDRRCVLIMENKESFLSCPSGCSGNPGYLINVLLCPRSFPWVNHLYSTRAKIRYISRGNDEVVLERGRNDERIHYCHWLARTFHLCGQITPQEHHWCI